MLLTIIIIKWAVLVIQTPLHVYTPILIVFPNEIFYSTFFFSFSPVHSLFIENPLKSLSKYFFK